MEMNAPGPHAGGPGTGGNMGKHICSCHQGSDAGEQEGLHQRPPANDQQAAGCGQHPITYQDPPLRKDRIQNTHLFVAGASGVSLEGGHHVKACSSKHGLPEPILQALQSLYKSYATLQAVVSATKANASAADRGALAPNPALTASSQKAWQHTTFLVRHLSAIVCKASPSLSLDASGVAAKAGVGIRGGPLPPCARGPPLPRAQGPSSLHPVGLSHASFDPSCVLLSPLGEASGPPSTDVHSGLGLKPCGVTLHTSDTLHTSNTLETADSLRTSEGVLFSPGGDCELLGTLGEGDAEMSNGGCESRAPWVLADGLLSGDGVPDGEQRMADGGWEAVTPGLEQGLGEEVAEEGEEDREGGGEGEWEVEEEEIEGAVQEVEGKQEEQKVENYGQEDEQVQEEVEDIMEGEHGDEEDEDEGGVHEDADEGDIGGWASAEAEGVRKRKGGMGPLAGIGLKKQRSGVREAVGDEGPSVGSGGGEWRVENVEARRGGGGNGWEVELTNGWSAQKKRSDWVGRGNMMVAGRGARLSVGGEAQGGKQCQAVRGPKAAGGDALCPCRSLTKQRSSIRGPCDACGWKGKGAKGVTVKDEALGPWEREPPGEGMGGADSGEDELVAEGEGEELAGEGAQPGGRPGRVQRTSRGGGELEHPVDDEYDYLPPGSYEVAEPNVEEIMAEHSHFCPRCNKGFKRDANLRMHMRGHGEQFRHPGALLRPEPQSTVVQGGKLKRFSCPFEGCRRNKAHKRFLPLKTMMCLRNHYRRSHCPKVLTCSKCESKKFSVVADLKTHEKHCGREKWLCSCRTTFSRQSKLLNHLALFTTHRPLLSPHLMLDMQQHRNQDPATSSGGKTKALDASW